MSYSIEALRKFNRMSREMLNRAKDEETTLSVSVSTGNVKIGRVMNVSLLPILTCGSACKVCMHDCYDIKACLQYARNVLWARVRNTYLAKHNRAEFFAQIETKINRRRKNKFFRWHVAGDILDFGYFSEMVEIAKRHSDFVFWTYTKQYSIVNAYCEKFGKSAIPSNLSVMFSRWDGLEMVNPFHFGEFSVYETEADRPNDRYICPGNCDICKANRRGCIANENTANKLH